MRVRGLLFVLIAFSIAVSIARSAPVLVPSDQPTIAAALSTGVDTVLVSPGVYPEDVQIGHGVTLIATGLARVRSMRTSPSLSSFSTVVVSGFRVDGDIHLVASSISVAACWADSTLRCDGEGVTVTGCRVFGGAWVTAGVRSFVTMNRFLGGGLRDSIGDGGSDVTDNYIEGPALVGLAVGKDVRAVRNVIRNCTTGISVGPGQSYAGDMSVADNVVLDCTGNGIDAPKGSPSYSGVPFTGNLVLRCGGDGMYIHGTSPTVQANRVEHAGGHGIDLNCELSDVDDNEVRDVAGTGIRVATLDFRFLRNRAIHCGQAGFDVTMRGGPLMGNLTGNNGGDGFHINSVDAVTTLRSNTSYLNGGDAFDLTAGNPGISADSLDHNIGVASGYGLRYTIVKGAAATRGCNDWYGNSLGATSGILPGTTDLLVDPLLCDAMRDDASLASASPALAPAGCGLIGAEGEGCATALDVENTPRAERFALRIAPVPASGGVRFEWPRRPGHLTLNVLDAAGARRWTASVDGGAGLFVWNGVDGTGARLAPGVYFAQIADGQRTTAGRIVILR